MSFVLDPKDQVDGLSIRMIAGANVTRGDLVYLMATGRVAPTNASAAATMPAMGMALRTATPGQGLRVLRHGIIVCSTWTWTPGELLYADTVAGAITQTMPLSPNIPQEIGIADNATRIYFNPQASSESIEEREDEFYPAPNPDSSAGNHAAMRLVDGGDVIVRMDFLIPTDFDIATWSVDAVVIPAGTGNMRRGVATDYGAVCLGEQYNAHTGTVATGEVAVTTGEIECIDLTGAIALAVSRDVVGMEFTRYGSHGNDTVNADCFFIGVVIRRPGT